MRSRLRSARWFLPIPLGLAMLAVGCWPQRTAPQERALQDLMALDPAIRHDLGLSNDDHTRGLRLGTPFALYDIAPDALDGFGDSHPATAEQAEQVIVGRSTRRTIYPVVTTSGRAVSAVILDSAGEIESLGSPRLIADLNAVCPRVGCDVANLPSTFAVVEMLDIHMAFLRGRTHASSWMTPLESYPSLTAVPGVPEPTEKLLAAVYEMLNPIVF